MLSRASITDLTAMRQDGVNLLLLPTSLSPVERSSAVELARRAKLMAIEPIPAASSIERTRGVCRSLRRNTGATSCVVAARSMGQADALVRADAVDLVVIQLPSPTAVLGAGLPGRGRLLAEVKLGSAQSFDLSAWARAIAVSNSRPSLDLAVSATTGGDTLASYLQVLATALRRKHAPERASRTSPNLFVAADGSDESRCSAERPCASFDRAYQVAQPGDTVRVAGGHYPPQTIGVEVSKVKAAANVTFRPAPGAAVTIDGDLHVLGSHITFRGTSGRSGFRLRNLYSDPTEGPDTSNHVSFEYLRGAAFEIGPNVNIKILGGDWGPNVCTGNKSLENSVTPLYTEPGRVPTNIVLDGLRIHDQNSANLSQCHMGGLNVVSASGMTIRNTVFSRNAVYDIEVGDFTRQFGNPRHVLLENNVFGAPVLQDRVTDDGQVELQLQSAGRYDDWLIRFNSFKNGIGLNFDGGGTYRNVRVLGNIGERADCGASGPTVTWAYNVWTDQRCGRTDRQLSRLPYVRAHPPADEDFHLRPRTAAGHFVRSNARDFALALDLRGRRRPPGHRAAGAYQPAP